MWRCTVHVRRFATETERPSRWCPELLQRASRKQSGRKVTARLASPEGSSHARDGLLEQVDIRLSATQMTSNGVTQTTQPCGNEGLRNTGERIIAWR